MNDDWMTQLPSHAETVAGQRAAIAVIVAVLALVIAWVVM
jgi:hypothetical protein